MKIIVDSLGSDKGPAEILKASRMAADFEVWYGQTHCPVYPERGSG